jgi:hypothetical protein
LHRRCGYQPSTKQTETPQVIGFAVYRAHQLGTVPEVAALFSMTGLSGMPCDWAHWPAAVKTAEHQSLKTHFKPSLLPRLLSLLVQTVTCHHRVCTLSDAALLTLSPVVAQNNTAPMICNLAKSNLVCACVLLCAKTNRRKVVVVQPMPAVSHLLNRINLHPLPCDVG